MLNAIGSNMLSSSTQMPRFISTNTKAFCLESHGNVYKKIYFILLTCSNFLQPVVTSQLGTINNLIHVKKSDFEVFDALQVDSLECSDTSGQD